MSKGIKKFAMGMLAALMLFGGGFAYTVNANQPQARCMGITGPPMFRVTATNATMRIDPPGGNLHSVIVYRPAQGRHVTQMTGNSSSGGWTRVTTGSPGANGWISNNQIVGVC